MYNFSLPARTIAALRHYDIISGITAAFTIPLMQEKESGVYQLGDNDADGIAAACAEIYGKYVGLMDYARAHRHGQDHVFPLLMSDCLSAPRHSGGHSAPGNILDGNLQFIHGIVLRTKIKVNFPNQLQK